MKKTLGWLLASSIVACGEPVEGPRGAQGPTGPAGPQGQMGAMGLPGSSGVGTSDVSISAITPSSVPGARTATLVISGFGTHFKAGTTVVTFSDTNIKVTKTDVASSTYLRVTIDVTSLAPIGAKDLTVTTPGAGMAGAEEKLVVQGGVLVTSTLMSELPTGQNLPSSVPQGGLTTVRIRNTDYRDNLFDPMNTRGLLGVSSVVGLVAPATANSLVDPTTFGGLVLVDALPPVGGLQVGLTSLTPLGQPLSYLSDPADTKAPQVTARTPIGLNDKSDSTNQSIAGPSQTALYKFSTPADNYVVLTRLHTLGSALRFGAVPPPRVIGQTAPTTGRFAEGMPFDTSRTIDAMGLLVAHNFLTLVPKGGDVYFAVYTDNLTGGANHSYTILPKRTVGTAISVKEPTTPDTPANPMLKNLTIDKAMYAADGMIEDITDADYITFKPATMGTIYFAASTTNGGQLSVQLLDATCTAMVGVNGARTAYGAAGQEETVSPAVTYCLKVSGQPKTPYTLILTQDIP
jgi:hypothetical protein